MFSLYCLIELVYIISHYLIFNFILFLIGLIELLFLIISYIQLFYIISYHSLVKHNIRISFSC